MKFMSLNERKEQFKKFEKQWLNESSMDMLQTKEWLDKMGVENYTINDGTVDVDGNVRISFKNLTEIPVQFGVVSGWFDCSNNNLTSLKGCPIRVGFWFDCSSNPLETLDGLPQSIRDDLYIKDTNLSLNEVRRIRQISNVGGKVVEDRIEKSIKRGVSTRRINFLKKKISEMKKELELIQSNR